MPFDLIGYRNKYKDFYGDAPLEDVAADVYKRGFANKVPDYETWKKTAGVSQVIQDDNDRINPPSIFEKLKRIAAPVEPKMEEAFQDTDKGSTLGGVVSSFGEGLARGLTTEIPKMVGGAAEFVGSYLPIGIEEAGKTLKDWAGEKEKEWYGDERARQGLERIVYEGSKMLAPSVVPAGIVGTGLRSLFGIGKLVKAARAAEVAGDAAKAADLFTTATGMARRASNIAYGTTAGLFGALQGQQTIDTANERADALEAQGNFYEAKQVRAAGQGLASLGTAAIEATGEFYGTKYLGKLFRLGEAEIVKRGAKNVVKDFLKTLGVEVGTEIGQQAGEAAVEKYFGIRPEADPLMEALDVIGPVAFMTLLTGGIAGATNRRGKDAPLDIAADHIKKMQLGAAFSDAIDIGLTTGKVGDLNFTPNDAIALVKRGLQEGIFTSEDIDILKHKHPALSEEFNALIVDEFKEKVNRVLGEEEILRPVKPIEEVKLPAGEEAAELPEKEPTPVTPAKPEIKPVEEVKPIPKELEPLAEEARKYKSAEEFIDNQSYFRRSDSATGERDVPWQLFTNNKEEIGSYGKYEFFTDDTQATNATSLVPKIRKLFNQHPEILKEYLATAKQLADDAVPERITTSAGLWDNPDLTQLIWDEILEPNNILKVRTPNGMIVFDKALVKTKPQLIDFYNQAKGIKVEPLGGEAKQPAWEMTNREFRDFKLSSLTDEQKAKWKEPGREASKSTVTTQWDEEHKGIIQQALSEGKPVSPTVLKDYPELGAATELSLNISKAITENPGRLIHGDTSKNAFWITGDGKIVPYNKYGDISDKAGAVSVHSHLPNNYKLDGTIYDTFNASDVKSLVWQKRNGAGDSIHVITSPTTYDSLSITKSTNPKFYSMGIGSLEKEMSPTKTERGFLDNQREKLKLFASKYGLEYKENLPLVLKGYPELATPKGGEKIETAKERAARVFKETEAKFAEEAASTETITEREIRRKAAEVIPYDKSLDIQNIDALPRGTGARYLLAIKGERDALIAKGWKRAVPPYMPPGSILVDMKARITPADKVIPEISAKASRKGAENLVTYLQKTGGIKFGKDFEDRVGKRGGDIIRQNKDVAVVYNAKRGIPIDERVQELNAEGWISPEGKPFTADSLVEILESGRAREIYSPEKSEMMYERMLRRMDREEWERTEAEVADLEIDSAAILESKGDIQKSLAEEIKAEGLVDEAAALKELEAFFSEAGKQPTISETVTVYQANKAGVPGERPAPIVSGSTVSLKKTRDFPYQETLEVNKGDLVEIGKGKYRYEPGSAKEPLLSEEIGPEPKSAAKSESHEAIVEGIKDKPWEWKAEDLVETKLGDIDEKLDKIWGPEVEFNEWHGGGGKDIKRHYVALDNAAELERAVKKRDVGAVGALLSDIKKRLNPQDYYIYEETAQKIQKMSGRPGLPAAETPQAERQVSPAERAGIAAETVSPALKPERYSVTEQPAKPIPLPTLADVQEVFKGQEVTQLNDGSIAIKTQGGNDLVVEAVDQVEPNAVTLQIGYGRNAIEEGEIVAERYNKGKIDLVRNVAGKWELQHGSIHHLEDMGILTGNEISLLQKHIANLVRDGKFETVNKADIGGAEDRANFLADALTKEPKGFLGHIIVKIQDFVDKIVNAFGIRTVGGIAREIKSGEIYGREEVRGETELGEKYAITKKPEMDRIGHLVEEAKRMARVKIEREAKFAEIPKIEEPEGRAMLPATSSDKARVTLSRFFNDAMYWIVDKNRPIALVQKHLGKVTDKIDVFLKETQRPKITAAKIKKAWEEDVSPLLDKMAEYKVEIQDLELYKHALHAHEANDALRRSNAKRQVEKIINVLENNKQKDAAKSIRQKIENLKRPDEWYKALNSIIDEYSGKEILEGTLKSWEVFSSKPSGMTDSEATEVLKEYQGDTKIENLGRMLDAINDKKLQLLYDSGLLPKEEFEAIKNKYEHYVPLYREGYENMLYTSSRGLRPTGRPIKVRGGSTRQVVNILGNSVGSYEKAINSAEKARSQKALYQLLKANPETDIIRMLPVKKSPSHDEYGNIRMYPDLFNVGDNEMRLMASGKQYLVSVDRNNRDAMLMMRTLKAEENMSGPIINTLAKLNRFLARVNTSWSPEFILSNFVRDIQTAGINIQDTGVKGKGLLTGSKEAWKAIYAVERGKPKETELEQYYNRFKMAGGKIGWSDVHGSVENLAKKLTAELEMRSGKRPTRKIVYDWIKIIEDINTTIENGVRLHVFKLAVDQGKTDEQAARIASDLTVDFTKKGAAGPVINALYLFSNAGIQGSYRIIRAATKSKAVRKSIAEIMGAGFVVGILNAIAGDEDDDGEDYFNKIDDFIRERNMIIMLPKTKGKYIKIPLPWGYNFFWNVGSEASRAFTQKKFSPLSSAGRLASTFVDAFNPVAAGTLLQTLSPTVIDPIAQVAENKNWFGGQLMPPENKFAKTPTPDSQRYWQTTGVASKWVAQQLNSLTGGDIVKPGLIDVSPETLDLFIDTAGGSAFKFGKDVFGIPMKAIQQEKIALHKIPFVRRIAGTKSEWADSRIFYENMENIYTAKEQLRVYRGTSEFQNILEATKTERAMFGHANIAEKRLKQLRLRLKRAELSKDEPRIEQINKQIEQTYINFNKAYYLKGENYGR